MRRTLRAAAAGLVAIAVSACVGSPAGRPAASAANGTPGAPGASATAGPARLPALVLTADPTDPAAAWTRVAFLPFGSGRDELGYLPVSSHRTSLPVLPASFAVGPDGSLWILDVEKRRIAHFAPDGTYLGAIGGFANDRTHPHPRDIAVESEVHGDRIYVVEMLHLASDLASVDSMIRGRAPLTSSGRATVATNVYTASGSGPPVVLLQGYADVAALGTGPMGFAVADPRTGTTRMLPGMPVGPGAWIDVRVAGDQDLAVTYTGASASLVRPVRIRLLGPRGTPVPANVEALPEAPLPAAIGVLVQAAPSRQRDGPGGGGRWYLRLANNGSPMVWERLPMPSLADDTQVRHLAVGPDGRVYLMIARPDGMLILRR